MSISLHSLVLDTWKRSLNLILFGLLVSAGLLVWSARSPAADEESPPKVWVGTWMNRKYDSRGPLQCTAVRKGDAEAQATFKGTFMGDPFSYDVTVSTKQEKDRTVLTGTATLDGDRYEWSGYVRGKVLFGTFRSLKGHNGEFRLQEVEKK